MRKAYFPVFLLALLVSCYEDEPLREWPEQVFLANFDRGMVKAQRVGTGADSVQHSFSLSATFDKDGNLAMNISLRTAAHWDYKVFPLERRVYHNSDSTAPLTAWLNDNGSDWVDHGKDSPSTFEITSLTRDEYGRTFIDGEFKVRLFPRYNRHALSRIITGEFKNIFVLYY